MYHHTLVRIYSALLIFEDYRDVTRVLMPHIFKSMQSK